MSFKSTSDIRPFDHKVWLSSPTMHGEEARFMMEAFDTNWMSTVGANINELETLVAGYVGVRHAVGLSSGTSAIHLAVKLAGERFYGQPEAGEGTLRGRMVLASDMTFDASVNPVAYECGRAVFVDTERDTWNMDPVALENAFKKYPDAKLVVLAHLYDVPGKLEELRAVCRKHGAVIVEDAAESLGATYRMPEGWIQTGSFGEYGCISFNGNKIITGSTGGMFLTDSEEDAAKVRKWSTQAREAAPWYQHEELGYNYRMSNVIAGVARGQFPYLKEHIAQKRAVYERYKEGLKDLPVSLNPYDSEKSVPNFWLSCMLIDKDYMCSQQRSDCRASYVPESGKSCPTEILETLAAYNAEGRPIWKPMHLQPIYRSHPFVAADAEGADDVGMDIFTRGLCLPSDNKMTEKDQDVVIELVKRCFA